jgi:receptor protein-tyrosine kinase
VPESTAFGAPDVEGLPAPEAEAFRMLRARLRYFNVDRNIKSLLIVSGQPGDGKSTVAYYLARAAANTSGTRVLLVEADLRRPQLADRLGLSRTPGLSEVLSQPIGLDVAVQSLPRSLEPRVHQEQELHILVAGALPPNPAELLESRRMQEFIEELAPRYDLVIFDTPPTGVVSDALPLLHQADGVVLIARLNRSTRAGLTRVLDQLKRLGAPVLGVVANHSVAERVDYGYGYGYGYDADSVSTNGGTDHLATVDGLGAPASAGAGADSPSKAAGTNGDSPQRDDTRSEPDDSHSGAPALRDD